MPKDSALAVQLEKRKSALEDEHEKAMAQAEKEEKGPAGIASAQTLERIEHLERQIEECEERMRSNLTPEEITKIYRIK